MNDDPLFALYRASATEEPDARLDAAILRAARRRRQPQLAAALAAVLVLASIMMMLHPEKPVPRLPQSTNAGLPPSAADGGGHYLAASARPQRLGMNVRPMAGD